MNLITLTCAFCSKSFQREKKEHTRQIKRGRTEFFCNGSCAASKSNADKPRPGNIDNLRSSNRRDEFTPFRWFVLRAQYRDRDKGYGCDLSVEFLKQLWEKQNGICPITGSNLILPHDSDGHLENDPFNASLDRIDGSVGYLESNVRFISLMANFGRHSFSDEQLINFCKIVAKNS